MPEITIIIPVYNAEPYIRRCMDSILGQTFPDFEVILVNDGSSDYSLGICQEYGRRDSRVIVLDKPNGGAASARNMGLDWYYENSKKDWMCFIDIDDHIHERYLEILLATAKEHHTRISMCSYEVTCRDRVECATERAVSCLKVPEELWCENQIACTVPVVKLFERELFRNIRFPEGIIHEDEYTLYKVLFQASEIAFIDLPLYGYYQTETSVMRGDWTPRHMTEPDGILSQLCFFAENHYEKAAAYSAGIYLNSIYRNLHGAKEKGDTYRREAIILRKRLKKELLRYGKAAGFTPQNAPWLYYEAFPTLTIPHRAAKKLFGKAEKR